MWFCFLFSVRFLFSVIKILPLENSNKNPKSWWECARFSLVKLSCSAPWRRASAARLQCQNFCLQCVVSFCAKTMSSVKILHEVFNTERSRSRHGSTEKPLVALVFFKIRAKKRPVFKAQRLSWEYVCGRNCWGQCFSNCGTETHFIHYSGFIIHY